MMGWVDETGGHGLFVNDFKGGGSLTPQSVVVIFCCLVT